MSMDENQSTAGSCVRCENLSDERSVSNWETMKRTNTKQTLWVSYGCIFCRVHSALIDVLDDVIVVLRYVDFHA